MSLLVRRRYSACAATAAAPLLAFVHPTAQVDPSVSLAPYVVVEAHAVVRANCKIGAGAVVGESVIVGQDSSIGSHVTLANCTVGKRAVIHAGARIGQDGFGFLLNEAGGDHAKKPQTLMVEIHDDVEIGYDFNPSRRLMCSSANCTIDRGSWRNTIIGAGTKMDNLIQIGHNVHVGRGCIFCAQTGIAGSTTIGNHVVIGGQVGVAQHLTIGDNVRIAAKSGVMHNIPAQSTFGGVPAVPIMQYRRAAAFLRDAGLKK
ncbi:Aste57867_14494 [Aphanomyces stellatus]|uniref:Aste57867_14494 protein n=1 Tax=Aphanomyces stellatus TaxID=120398 RepID=A0A485L0X0_9STRA|nr:hypothetical protein As57867_014440 [Aphanomyces stellatus]VFT91316.1 Aste57867_14494 [Aphanomyces stellatus]